MIDVVYTLANFSKFKDDWELRYSLRSLAAQAWVGNVYLVGHCPAWAKNVIHVPCLDPYSKSKDANIINKVLLACSLPGLSETFAVTSDDHYILRPVEFTEIGPWLENPCQYEEALRRQRVSSWCRRLIKTVEACRLRGWPDFVTESHIPYLVDKRIYPKTFASLPWGDGSGLLTHIYFNATRETAPPDPGPEMVLRLKRPVDPEELQALTAGRTYFNHNNDGLCPAVQSWLEGLFPEPSPWEG